MTARKAKRGKRKARDEARLNRVGRKQWRTAREVNAAGMAPIYMALIRAYRLGLRHGRKR